MASNETATLPQSILDLNIPEDAPIYFQKKNEFPNVFEIVNAVLEPHGYEEMSSGQFSRIAGGSSNSSNRIPNLATGRGQIANGFTHLSEILDYCQASLENSVLVPLEDVISEFKWAKEAINEKYITLHSRGKMRYDVEGIMDITKGLLNEVAFKRDCEQQGIEVELNRDFYKGTSNTDQGQDVSALTFQDGKRIVPKIKIQIKDVQYFFLISKNEFEGERSAQLFVGYKVHWKKANTGQRFFRSLGGRGEEVFSDFPALNGVRVERRGWAKPEDFKELPPKTPYKGMKFNDNNMYVYWDELRNMSTLFPLLKGLVS